MSYEHRRTSPIRFPPAGAVLSVENRLRALRAEAGISQGDLARWLGVSRQTINAVETNKYDPSLPLAMRMSKVFGVPVDAIFLDDWILNERP